MEDYVKISPLLNPYNDSQAISQWVYMVRQNDKVPNITKIKTRNIHSLMNLFREAPKDYADYYIRQRNTDLDQQVPRWDISLADLKRVYDQARFDTYLDWVQFVKLDGGSCSKKQIKRRIPWLYAKTGLYLTFQ